MNAVQAPCQPLRRLRGGTQPLPLTRSDILDAAVPLLAAVGVDRLTIKSVADALGITSPAVYHYVNGRDDLVDRLCERVAAEANRNVECLIDPTMAWDDAVVAVLLEMDRTFARYPGVAARVLRSRRKSRAADATAVTVRRLLVSGGYGDSRADEVVSALQYLFGGWLLGRHNTDQAMLERSIRWLLAGSAA
jgi:TetR/AcrR family transcriptional regulator, tetracycline repressor protein